MKDNIVIILLVVMIGILSGVGILFGVGNAVQVASAPLAEKIQSTALNQEALGRKMDALARKLEMLDKKISTQRPVAQQPPGEDMDTAYTIPDGNSIIVGKKDAPITIVQFTDLQCPFCRQFYPPIKEALNAYPDKVRFILKNFPLSFHPNARPAAKLALAAAEQGKYIEMVELLLANGASVSDAKITEYAKELGLNEQKLRDDAKNKDAQYEADIKADMDLAMQVDVRGTPTFFINGKKTMARDFNGFKQQIDAILAGQ